MVGPVRTGIFLGIDIGRVNTRAAAFGVSEGKYRLLASKMASTDYGKTGHLAVGIHESLRMLQEELDINFVHPAEPEFGSFEINQRVVSQVGMSLSSLKPIKGALFGLTTKGSLAAGRSLFAQLPVTLSGVYGAADLGDEPAVIESLLEARPGILFLTGGEDSGAEAPLTRWIEVIRLLCRVLPKEIEPVVFFAGNPKLEPIVRRRLEPICRLVILPNLQPMVNELDDIPSKIAISHHIISQSMKEVPEFQGLSQLVGNQIGTRGSGVDRMVRFLSRLQGHRPGLEKKVIAIDIGADSTLVCAGNNGQTVGFRHPLCEDDLATYLADATRSVYQWTAAPVDREGVASFLAKQTLYPEIIPQTLPELALSQSLARFKIRSTMLGLVERVDGFPYHAEKGLIGAFDQVIASGAALTNAPTHGQAMLMLMDGLQPWRETLFILDSAQILPLLGLLGELDPLLPVHLLDSGAFLNLGTVIPVVSAVAEGMIVLQVDVSLASGKRYDLAVPKGSLRRLIVPSGERVTLTLDPIPNADVGGGPGVQRQITVKAGSLGVVIDARGRPLFLPVDDDERLEKLRHWLWTLGG
jgi:hypothetical protein